jgi:hypothetical protein
MERVAFLVEASGKRIDCMLNPDSVVIRRQAGVSTRSVDGKPLNGIGMSENALVYTGGGTTQLALELLFDVTQSGLNVKSDNARDLTAPLWQLTENVVGTDGFASLPLVRFVWGKSWNIPGIITTISERLEAFTPDGKPQRSWLKLRLIKVNEPKSQTKSSRFLPTSFKLPEKIRDIPEEQLRYHQIMSGSSNHHEMNAGERLDKIAAKWFGNPALWRLIADFNNIDNPLKPSTQALKIPVLWSPKL